MKNNSNLAHKGASGLPATALVKFYVTCGKSDCRCAFSKEHRHGPYYYNRHRPMDGRRSKNYIRAADVEAAQQLYRDRKQQRADLTASTDALHALRDNLRGVEQQLKQQESS